jgi:hypothetical protein
MDNLFIKDLDFNLFSLHYGRKVNESVIIWCHISNREFQDWIISIPSHFPDLIEFWKLHSIGTPSPTPGGIINGTPSPTPGGIINGTPSPTSA